MSNEVKRIGVKQAQKDSIILIGPIGVGKSLISSELSKRNYLPVITTDLMRHCPKTIEEIQRKKDSVIKEIENLKNKLNHCKDLKESEKIKDIIKNLRNDEWVCDRQFEMRKLLPNLPNYQDLGYNGDVSNFLRDKFGIVAWHFYQKQFENQLLKALTEQIDFTCIIDMGGGMSVSLDSEYAQLEKKFKEIDDKLFLAHFDLSKIGFNHIKEAFLPFKNIISLELPKSYKNTMKKAEGNLEINNLFIKSGQNNQLATQTIQVEGLIDGDKVNWTVLNSICEELDKNLIC